MAAAAGQPYDDGLMKNMLQSAVQSVQWTYTIFWKLSPQGRVLVWGDGYYNGAIKTRKTVQPVEVSTEEAALSRSEQLRELYDSLETGDHQVTENQQQPPIRRPSVALSPEDLTESEWFYLMCVSFSFPLGDGLVGEAYVKQQQLWLTGANEVDSKVFSRAILAKSAHIQTVICIPLLNGVVELGTTEKVEETVDFVRHVKTFFTVDNNDNHRIILPPPPKPALSAHSSNTTFSSHHQIPTTIKLPENGYSMDEDDVENDEDEEEEEEDVENGSDFEAETGHISEDKSGVAAAMEEVNDQLLEVDMCEDIRFESPINDGSSNLDSAGFQLLPRSQADSCRADSPLIRWSDSLELHQLHASDTFKLFAAAEDGHYSRTVSTILQSQSAASGRNSVLYSTTQSSFTTWTSNHHPLQTTPSSNSQWLLKYMLYTVPFLHINTKSSDSIRKTTSSLSSHEELMSANHVLAERRRREKLNERFIILRSLVPLVTKMDKASILDDTIEYVKQLRKKVQDLEALDNSGSKMRMIRAAEGGGGGRAVAVAVAVAMAVQVEVSIIESDALVEIQCVDREGLLLDVMKRLRELGVEITTVQSCVNGGMCTAEMRAKVKAKGNNGKKISIMQVKKAINQIVSPPSLC